MQWTLPIFFFFFLKKNSKIFKKNHFKKIVIFSKIVLLIFHNIGLYIYTVKYKSGIKIPGFLQNIFLKKFKTFSKRKNILLHTAKF